LSMEPMN